MRMETSKQPLRIENGRFMRGDVEVPAEIGNAEQIALLQSIERQVDEAMENGVRCAFFVGDIRFDAIIRFKCVCGRRVRKTTECSDWDREDREAASRDAWNGETVTCPSCGRKYEIDDLGFAKLINSRI